MAKCKCGKNAGWFIKECEECRKKAFQKRLKTCVDGKKHKFGVEMLRKIEDCGAYYEKITYCKKPGCNFYMKTYMER